MTANLSVTASFAIDTYTLTYTAGANGTIIGDDPADGQLRRGRHGGDGASRTLGYHFVSWSDGVLTASPDGHQRDGEHERHGQLRDQHLHPDLHGGRERYDHGHDAADGRTTASDGTEVTAVPNLRLPLRELERRRLDGRPGRTPT